MSFSLIPLFPFYSPNNKKRVGFISKLTSHPLTLLQKLKTRKMATNFTYYHDGVKTTPAKRVESLSRANHLAHPEQNKDGEQSKQTIFHNNTPFGSITMIIRTKNEETKPKPPATKSCQVVISPYVEREEELDFEPEEKETEQEKVEVFPLKKNEKTHDQKKEKKDLDKISSAPSTSKQQQLILPKESKDSKDSKDAQKRHHPSSSSSSHQKRKKILISSDDSSDEDFELQLKKLKQERDKLLKQEREIYKKKEQKSDRKPIIARYKIPENYYKKDYYKK